MGKYRKKPVVIEAVQFKDCTIETACEIAGLTARGVQIHGTPEKPFLRIETLEGVMKANLGDWIIKGIKGEFYPCKPDIFEQTYEPVAD